MKPVIRSIISALIVLITMTGCLQIKTEITVNPDGSGQIDQTLFMKNEFIEMMSSFQTAGSGGSDSDNQQDEFSFYDEEELRQRAEDMGEGVTYVSSEEVTKDKFQGYHAVYKFTDIGNLKIDQDPSAPLPSSPSATPGGPEPVIQDTMEENIEYITFSHSSGNPAVLTINLPTKEDTESEQDDQSGYDESMEPMMREMYKDMKIEMEITVNGSIVETNAGYTSDNTVSLIDIDMNKLMGNNDLFQKLLKGEIGSFEKMATNVSDIEGVHAEKERKVTIKYQ